MRFACVAALAACLAGASVPAAAQSTAPEPRVVHTIGTRVAIGRSVVVARDEEVRDALLVIGGSARVDGRVRDGLVVIGGDVELGPDADVRGDVVLVGGTLMRAPGARLDGAVSTVSIGRWWRGWSLHGPWAAGDDVFFSWLGLAAAGTRLVLLGLLAALIVLVARARVARVGRAAAAEPARALLIGLAAEMLFVPVLAIVAVALCVTIIGIPIALVLVPLAMLAALTAFLLGFTALACRVGEWLEDRLGLRIPSALFATALGMLLIVGPGFLARLAGGGLAAMHGVALSLLVAGALVEFGVWTMGLGATLMTGFGRWATAPPPIPT